MPISDKWTLGSHITAARQELVDPNGKWWTDTELTYYINDWQQDVQNLYELVWGSATITTSTDTITLTAVATDIFRLDAVYWNNVRLTPKDKTGLDNFRRDWRGVTGPDPVVTYQGDINSVSLYPAPIGTGTLIFEYPLLPITLASSTDTSPLPGWVKYSSINYSAMKAYRRAGPRQDVNRAQMYKTLVQRDFNEIRLMKDAYQPEKFLTFRPATKYEREVLQPDLVKVK